MLLGNMGHLLLYEHTQNWSHVSILVDCIDPENNYNNAGRNVLSFISG